MAQYIQQRTAGDIVSYRSKYTAVHLFRKHRKKIGGAVMFSLVSAPISPATSLFFLFYASIYMYALFKDFFMDQRRFERYTQILQPKSSPEVLSEVGYQVFSEELESHLALIKDRSEEGKKKLGQKQKSMESDENGYRRVGFDKDLMTTHILMPGKTGAGKTEGVRSIADDVFAFGGGSIINDGKSDETMMREFSMQAKRRGRETSGSVLNFLKPEKMSETNSFNPVGIMHPVKIVEFLGNLIGGGSGDGNAKYFFNRGKAMLFPVVNATHTRNRLFREGFSLDRIFENTTVIGIGTLQIATYCMARDMNEIIKNNKEISALLRGVPTIVSDQNFNEVEKLIDYVTQNPQKLKKIEKMMGIEYRDVREIYSNSYVLLKSYLTKVWNQYEGMLDIVSRLIYDMASAEKRSYYGDGAMGIDEIKKHYHKLKTALGGEKDKVGAFVAEYGFAAKGYTKDDFQAAFEAMYRATGNIENPPADAIQQHAYAQQQWDALSNTFATFRHVFGQTKSEIKPEKLIRENRFLYILLPPLEQSPDQVEILGKMIIMTIREVAAIALGGEQLSIHKTLAYINKDKATPKPFTLVVLDEYGAYPVPGIDTLLAQVRSLNMSMVLSVQDFASTKTGGDNITSQERALANTTKWFLKAEDKAIVDWLGSMIGEEYIEKPKMQRDAYGELIATADTEIVKEKVFDPEKLRDFGNGFSMLLTGSDSDGVTFVQSFYRGGDAENIFIKRRSNLAIA